jgi:hypothetical protein
MIEPATLIAALAALGVWLDRLNHELSKKSEARHEALTAVLAALSATKSHLYDDVELGAEEARAKEHELAQLWSAAAGAVNSVDSDMSTLFMMKSDAWSRPSAWSDERIQAAGISIEEVERRAKDLMKR